MKRFAAVLLTLAVLLCPSVRAAGPGISAASAILIDGESGRVLYAQNAEEERPIASITKLMTALVAAEYLGGDLSETVEIKREWTGIEGTSLYLKPGETITLKTLLYGLLLHSGNDAAVALAGICGGEVETFVGWMNQRAQELGMADTTFLNCTGLPAQGHQTSAHDIALMSRELILNHPSIREYTTIWMDSIRNGAFGLTNTNRLIRFYQGATGLKTGSTDSALYCMSATAERDGMELIAVVMKAPTTAQRFDDAKALLDYGFANYALVDVYPDAPLAPVDVLLGTVKQVQPQLNRDCRLLVRKGEESQVTTQLTVAQDVEAPVDQGQTLGQMEVYVGGELRDTIPIVSAQQVDRLTVPGIFGQLLRQLLMAR